MMGAGLVDVGYNCGVFAPVTYHCAYIKHEIAKKAVH